MTVTPENIEVDRCYLLDSPAGLKVCRVVGILPTGALKYRHRPADGKPTGQWRSARTGAALFAAKIIREVPCDWRPEGVRKV